ncbi:hypothetical protein CKA32_007146 [Geitlerinema sp. FC II]|nr:hypothetical protein CKA32_007146 [Geitlerinema sp. FC II]
MYDRYDVHQLHQEDVRLILQYWYLVTYQYLLLITLQQLKCYPF